MSMQPPQFTFGRGRLQIPNLDDFGCGHHRTHHTPSDRLIAWASVIEAFLNVIEKELPRLCPGQLITAKPLSNKDALSKGPHE